MKELLDAITLVHRFEFGNQIYVVVYSCDGGKESWVHAPDHKGQRCSTLEEALHVGADLFRKSIGLNCESTG